MKLEEFASREGISVQRAARLAREHRIPNAVKVGNQWELPAGAAVERRDGRPISPQSRADFLGFLHTGTLDHVTGTRKKRAGERIRQFWASDDPAKLLRDWWGGTPSEGRGGAALVRAAQKGYDWQVRDVHRSRNTWILDSPDLIKRRVGDYRAIRGLTIDEVADAAHVDPQVVSMLERQGVTPTTNRDAARVIRALDIKFMKIVAERASND